MSLLIAPATVVVPITGAAMSAVLIWIVMVYFVALLLAQALGTAVEERSKLRPLGRYLTVGTIPLFFVFLLTLTLRVLESFL